MYKIAKPLFLHCLTPMHAGSGSDLGIIDLPIQRERHTSFPKIEASSLKGALREACEFTSVVSISDRNTARANLIKLNRVFGYDDASLAGFRKQDFEEAFSVEEEGQSRKMIKDFAGAIGFSDARLLLFPIKSMRGVFVWATCAASLKQLQSDLSLATDTTAYQALIDELGKIKEPKANTCFTSSGTAEIDGKNGKKVVLEEYTFSVEGAHQAAALAKQLATALGIPAVQDKLVILPNDDFKDFVNLSTEVITRTKISNVTGTVETGALFTEEYLPTESVLYALVMAHDEFRDQRYQPMNAEAIMTTFSGSLPNTVQIGGNMTLGKGLTRLHGLS